jgi:hypothetical protein
VGRRRLLGAAVGGRPADAGSLAPGDRSHRGNPDVGLCTTIRAIGGTTSRNRSSGSRSPLRPFARARMARHHLRHASGDYPRTSLTACAILPLRPQLNTDEGRKENDRELVSNPNQFGATAPR